MQSGISSSGNASSIAAKAARHCEFVFGEEEKDKLVEYMRLYERFGGLRVISY